MVRLDFAALDSQEAWEDTHPPSGRRVLLLKVETPPQPAEPGETSCPAGGDRQHEEAQVTQPRGLLAWLSDRPKKVSSWTKEVRDAFLLLVGAGYVLGYIVWSMYALRANLGLLPALRAQYLLAGLLPLLLLIPIVLGMISGTESLLDHKVGRWGSRRRSVVTVIFFLSAWLFILSAIFLSSDVISAPWALFMISIGEVLVVIGFAIHLYSPPGGPRRKLYRVIYVFVIPISLGVAAFIAYRCAALSANTSGVRWCATALCDTRSDAPGSRADHKECDRTGCNDRRRHHHRSDGNPIHRQRFDLDSNSRRNHGLRDRKGFHTSNRLLEVMLSVTAHDEDVRSCNGA